MRGLERFRAIGGDLASVASVASFFVSRVDAETDARLDALGADPELKGKMGIANAKLAYQQYRQRFSGDRWESFASLGALPQRCLWASTSVKDPSERDVRYVEGLVGEHTITTIPVPTLQAFQDHGEVRRTLSANVEAAAGVYHAVAAAGVDHLDVSRTLERDGVRRFQQSFDELLAGIERERCHASRPSG